MTNYSLPYGDSSVTISLDEKQVKAVLTGNKVEPITSIKNALYSAMDCPIKAEPLTNLKTSTKVALVISDMSRFWMRQDLVVPHIISYLTERCSVQLENITIVIANGTHLADDEKTMRTLVTDAVYDSVKLENHDCLAKDLVYLGTTSYKTPVHINKTVANADWVICLGACTHHVLAGYGGGRKSILPGVSGIETINHNHAYSLDPNVFRSNPRIGNGVLENNPLHQDMCEAADMLPNLFMINLVMNADMQLAGIFAGHPHASWEAGCKEVDRIYCRPIDEQADVVIASCGGYPKDMSLYQGTKSIDNLESAIKIGGTLILCIEAREGGGPEEYFDWIVPLQENTIEEKLRNNFTIPGYIFFLNCEQASRFNIKLLTSIPNETVAPMGIKAYSTMDALMADMDFTDKTIYVVPNGSTVIPVVN